MYASTQRSFLVTALLGVSLMLTASARRTRAWANSLAKRLEHRRSRRMAIVQLAAMSERELRDIGLSRSDIERVAANAVDERNPFRID